MEDKLNSKTLIVLLLLKVAVIQSDEICDAIVIDSITTLQNGTIVIFRRNEVWLLQKDVELLGPCPISGIFEEMKGPVDAALTITTHDSITEFIGSSIYFVNGSYFTYRNLGQYNVEWGSLVYLPHKGLQQKMGSTDPEVAKLMTRKISAAFFDPTDGKSKFIFSDGSIFGFAFELGAEYDRPVLSSLNSEFKKYGIERVPSGITAALTLTINKVPELLLFEGSKYCSFKLSSKLTDQICEWKMVREGFLNCNQIVRKNGFCGKVLETQPFKSIEAVAVHEQSIDANKGNDDRKSGIVSRHVASKTRADSKLQNVKTKSSGHSLLFDDIVCKLILDFLLVICIQIFC